MRGALRASNIAKKGKGIKEEKVGESTSPVGKGPAGSCWAIRCGTLVGTRGLARVREGSAQSAYRRDSPSIKKNAKKR